jgi:signal transduction histidine kinase
MLRQVLMNLTKNALEAQAKKMVVSLIADGIPHASRSETSSDEGESTLLYIGNDGLPIPAENRQSLFVPFFTTKRSGSGIGLSLSRRMMIQQGGMLELAEKQQPGCRTGFVIYLINSRNLRTR